MARVTFNGRAYEAALVGALRRTMAAVGGQGEYHAKTDVLNRPGDGNAYPRGKTVSHVASSPGSPPAPDSGRMRASVTHEVLTYPDAVASRVAVNTQYALPLEEGTERIAPRPFRALILLRLRQVFPGALRRYL